MPLRPCLEPRCRRLVKRGRCRTHRSARSAEREATPNRAVYRDSRWRNGTRPAALKRAGHRCEVLERGRRCSHTDESGRTLQVHHHPQTAAALIALALDPFDVDRVRVACDHHHGKLGQQERP
jgi:hypothetical protein